MIACMGDEMTALFGIFLLVGLWLVLRAFNSAKPSPPPLRDTPPPPMIPKPSPPPLRDTSAPPEIPMTVKNSYEPSASSAASDPESDKDNWEGSFGEVQEAFPVTASLRISYEDGAGNRTERIVDVRQFGTDGYGNLLIGHCRMRNATRTFRPDRIKKCVDEDTGEIVNDVCGYLRAKYESSPEHSLDILHDEESDSLRVLLFVGKADGQLRAAEKAIIRGTCRTLAGDSRLTDELIDEMLSALDVPTLAAFRMAVGRLAKKAPEARAALVKAAEDMVATQKTVHASEQEALEYMRKRFAAASDAAL